MHFVDEDGLMNALIANNTYSVTTNQNNNNNEKDINSTDS